MIGRFFYFAALRVKNEKAIYRLKKIKRKEKESE